MGYKLANRIREILKDEGIREIDAVIPIPETSKTSAFCVAERLDLPYSEAFVKNRYVFRTFIMPGQGIRQKSVRRKLSTIDQEFSGKCVLLVDDSIVRGTTSKEIVSPSSFKYTGYFPYYKARYSFSTARSFSYFSSC
jgi:amidophosphoribosyltransferase